MTIVLQFYPNGEFSQGVDTSSNRPPKNVCKTLQTSPSGRTYTIADIERAKELNAEISPQTYNTVGYVFKSSIGIHYVLKETTEAYCVLERVGDVSECNRIHLGFGIPKAVFLGFLFPLVHQSVESCEKPRSRKKLQSMSKRMSRNIRNGVYLLEKGKGGKDVLSFLTLTLPRLSTDGLRACCENWDSMVKRFFDWLRLHLKKSGLALEHVYCTEIQTKRLTNRGEYAPHLHVVFKGRANRRGAWAVTPGQARRAWAKCIHAFTNEVFSTTALENLQRIKYSAARYLSKYLSKGANIIPDASEGSTICYLRTQWGGMARTVSQGIRKATQRFTGRGGSGSIAWYIFDNIERLVESGFILYFKRGFIPLHTSSAEGVEYGLHVGCGCLSTPTLEGGLINLLAWLYGQPSIP